MWARLCLKTPVFCCALLATNLLIAGTFAVNSREEATMMKHKVRASQFLHRATFGPTSAQIDTLADRIGQIGLRRACDEWIDEQFDEVQPTFHQEMIESMLADETDDNGVPYTSTTPGVWIQRFRYHAWWHIAMTAEDQLRQRVAWALIQILVTSKDGNGLDDESPGNISGKGRWLGASHYYDKMVSHAFGNYRDLLQDVTYHPAMGVYLSHAHNMKSDGNRFPDENYAREIMQLFTIGLYELHSDGRLKTTSEGNLIPTYNNETIKNFARVFTGLTFKASDEDDIFWSGNDFQYPMEMYQPEHDTDPKTLLGGQVVDIDDGDDDIGAALDNLFAHPNVGPFVSYRLIQRLVKSNPSRAYIRRVATKFDNNGNNVKGDMKAVIKAILLDPEAWSSIRVRVQRPHRVIVETRGTEYSKLREPVIRYASMLRGLDSTSDYPTGRMMLNSMAWQFEQAPYHQPNVFNFYKPGYQPPGDLIGYKPSRRIPNQTLVAPEFQQMTAVISNRMVNHYIWQISQQQASFDIFSDTKCTLSFDLTAQKQWASIDADMPKLLDHLDLLFCAGTLPQDYKDHAVQVIVDETNYMRDNPSTLVNLENERVEAALIAVLTSPFCAVQE